MRIYGKYNHLIFCLALIFSPAVMPKGIAIAGPNTAENTETRALIKELQSGGLVMYMRHATTDRSQVDQDRNDLTNCATQRNLSAAGRDQARAVGVAIRALKIPIGSVITSPYCRCQETARLAFGTLEVSDDLRFGLGNDKQQTAHLSQALKQRLSTAPAEGANTILVSHTANLKEAAGIWPEPEGAAYVFKPLPDDNFKYVGKIPPDAWTHQVPVQKVSSSVE